MVFALVFFAKQFARKKMKRFFEIYSLNAQKKKKMLTKQKQRQNSSQKNYFSR